MIRVSKALGTLFCVMAFAVSASPALAQQDPCAESGPDCRLLTAAEISALKARLLALQAVLPVPDPARFAPPPDLAKAMVLPFVAELEAGGAMISGSWPLGAFTERNDVHHIYDGRAKPAPKAADSKDPLAAVQQMQAAFGNRIEVLARLLPHAYLVENVHGGCVDISDPEATDIEKTSTFLTWMANDGTVLTTVFGPRICKEEETLRVDKPAKNLAPVTCIRLEITGPDRAEVLALKKRIDRKAFEALLGAVMK
jgi:hypothetical protein